jgi:hypothetical protein
MTIRKKILHIISRNSNYPALGAVSIQESHLMYTHGSEEEFDVMTSDIETEFDITLSPSTDKNTGDMTVKEFVDEVMSKMPTE